MIAQLQLAQLLAPQPQLVHQPQLAPQLPLAQLLVPQPQLVHQPQLAPQLPLAQLLVPQPQLAQLLLQAPQQLTQPPPQSNQPFAQKDQATVEWMELIVAQMVFNIVITLMETYARHAHHIAQCVNYHVFTPTKYLMNLMAVLRV